MNYRSDGKLSEYADTRLLEEVGYLKEYKIQNLKLIHLPEIIFPRVSGK